MLFMISYKKLATFVTRFEIFDFLVVLLYVCNKSIELLLFPFFWGKLSGSN